MNITDSKSTVPLEEFVVLRMQSTEHPGWMIRRNATVKEHIKVFDDVLYYSNNNKCNFSSTQIHIFSIM